MQFPFAPFHCAASPIYPHYFISSNFLFDIIPCPLFFSTWHPLLLHLSHARYDTTTSLVHYSSSNNCISSGTPFSQYFSTLFFSSSTELLLHPYYTSHNLAIYVASSSSALLNFLFSFCAFPFIGCTSSLFWCTFCGFATRATCKGTPLFPPLNGTTTLRSYLSLFY